MKPDPNSVAAILPYTLKACQNLEQHFLCVNDLESAAYFRRRIKQLQSHQLKRGEK